MAGMGNWLASPLGQATFVMHLVREDRNSHIDGRGEIYLSSDCSSLVHGQRSSGKEGYGRGGGLGAG